MQIRDNNITFVVIPIIRFKLLKSVTRDERVEPCSCNL